MKVIFYKKKESSNKKKNYVFNTLTLIISSLGIMIAYDANKNSGDEAIASIIAPETVMIFNEKESGVYTHNIGTGPAYIKSVSIHKKDRNGFVEVVNTTHDFRRAFDLEPEKFSVSPIRENEAIDKSEVRWWIKAKNNDTLSKAKIAYVMDNINISFCSCNWDGICDAKSYGLKLKENVQCPNERKPILG